MKLLFDENLAPIPAERLKDISPGSVHVHDCLSGTADDVRVWDYAKQNGLIVTTKDSDFNERGMIFGHPPKVIWLKVGNCPTDQVEAVLRRNSVVIHTFETDANAV